MKSSNAKGWLLVAVCLTVASIISWVDFGLYISRLKDSVGIGLSAAMALAFTIAAAGFYIEFNKRRNKLED